MQLKVRLVSARVPFALALILMLTSLITTPQLVDGSALASTSAAGDEYWWPAYGNPGLTTGVAHLLMDSHETLYATAGGIKYWNTIDWTTELPWQPYAIMLDAQDIMYFSLNTAAASSFVYRWDGVTQVQLGGRFNVPAMAFAMDSQGTLYAGGSFTSIDGLPYNRIARWDGSTWQPLGSGINGTINALAIDSNDNVYAAGLFTLAGGDTAYSIAKWDGAHWTALGAGIWGGNATVRALAFHPVTGDLYAAGSFTGAGSVSANCVARWDGTQWYALGAGRYGIYALAFDSSNNLYAGGSFSGAVAKWDGLTWTTLPGSMSGTVTALLYQDGILYVGGIFTAVSNAYVNYIARWDGSQWSGFGGGADYPLSALTFDDSGNLLAGGEFVNLGATLARGVARWNGHAWTGLGSGIDGDVNALAVDASGGILAGGVFSTAGGVTMNNISRWNGSTWQALGSGIATGTVYALAADDSGGTYAGGSFTSAGGVSVSNVAYWNGGAWEALDSGTNDQVRALAVHPFSGDLYAAGWFTQAGGVSASHIAMWDGSVWQALSSEVNGDVLALVFDAVGNLYAAGDFTTAGGLAANRLARWDGSSWHTLGSGANASVRALAVTSDGGLVAGGDFTIVDGVSANRLAFWDGSQWAAFGSGMDKTVRAVAASTSGEVFAGGLFASAGGIPARYVAWYYHPYTISGTLRNAGGEAVEGIVIDVLYARTTSDSQGEYRFSLPAWDYTLTPSKPHCSLCGFTPTRRQVSVTTADLSGQDFIINPIYYTISGTILDANGYPLAGVSVSNGTQTVISDLNGIYRLTDLTAGSYTITPSRAKYTFTPASRSVSLSDMDAASQDFLALKPGYQVGTAALLLPETSQVYAVIFGPSGDAYAGGNIPVLHNIGWWDGSQWNMLGSGLNSSVRALSYCAGWLYAGGYFTSTYDGGVTLNHIARWDGSAWQPMGSGIGSEVTALACDLDGTLVAGLMDGTAHRWNGDAWSMIYDNTSGFPVIDIVIAPDGSMYLNDTLTHVWDGSQFVEGAIYTYTDNIAADSGSTLYANGSSNAGAGLIRWNGSAWVLVSANIVVDTLDLAIGAGGEIVLGGPFSSIDGRDIRYLSAWDGLQFQPVDPSLTGGAVRALAIDPQGNILAGGSFTSVAGKPVYGLAAFKKLHEISGTIRDEANLPLAGVTVKLGNSSVISGADGSYRLVPQAGDCRVEERLITATCTVQPSLDGYTFDPLQRQVIVQDSEVTGQDFRAIRTYSISGSVLDETGQALEGVLISVSNGLTTTSDANGVYILPGLISADYTLTPSLPGCALCTFEPASRQVSIDHANVSDQNFTATWGLTISGRVVDQSAQGVPGVLISATGGFTATTSADGSYILANLVVGTYTLTPSLSDCAGCSFTPTTRQVVLGKVDITGQNFTATMRLSISGQVLDEVGEALGGVLISLSNGQQTTSAPDGSYAFTDLLSGTYTLTPSLANHIFDPLIRQVTLTLTDVSGQDFSALLRMDISGKVINEQLQGVAGVVISLNTGTSITTGKDGSYTITNLVPGDYILTPSLPACVECYFSPPARDVSLTDESISDVNFSAYLRYSILGQVVDEAGQPLAGVNIDYNDGIAVTGLDGNYAISGLPVGSYTLMPSLPDCADCSFTPGERDVNVVNEDLSGQDFTGHIELSISGKVIDQVTQDGVVGVTVILDDGISTTSAADGSYKFNGLGPGSYNLSAELLSCADCTFSSGVVILSIADAREQDIPAWIRFSISGHIDGGLEGISIIASNGLSTTTDSHGDYILTGFSAGSYTLTPSLPGCALCSFNPASVSLELISSDLRAPNIEVLYSFTVSGMITDEHGKPVVAMVVIAEGPSFEAGLTDMNGFYQLSGLRLGTYRITPQGEICPDCRFVPESWLLVMNTADQQADFEIFNPAVGMQVYLPMVVR